MGHLREKLLSLLTKRQKEILKGIYFILVRSLHVKKKIKGKRNKITCKGSYLKKVTFNVVGDDNYIEIRRGAMISNTRFHVFGSRHHVVIKECAFLDGVALVFEDNDCKIIIGEKTHIYNHTHIAAVEPGSVVQIGANCLFSGYVDIRTTDSHSIIDLHSRKRINYAQDITIGDHVWLGTHVAVLKGVTIGNDVMVGMKALVTKDIPGNCVAAGFPARVVRENTTWKPERIYQR